MIVNLTIEQITDIRKGLIIAMQAIDRLENDHGTDKILADKLEKIDQYLSAIQARN